MPVHAQDSVVPEDEVVAGAGVEGVELVGVVGRLPEVQASVDGEVLGEVGGELLDGPEVDLFGVGVQGEVEVAGLGTVDGLDAEPRPDGRVGAGDVGGRRCTCSPSLSASWPSTNRYVPPPLSTPSWPGIRIAGTVGMS
ncbi:hypothetical protein DDE05_44185 [Streptomyces cavourensis]|nr:hypothetical protein DDE05_44185 [Streptomyces cavourensis]